MIINFISRYGEKEREEEIQTLEDFMLILEKYGSLLISIPTTTIVDRPYNPVTKEWALFHEVNKEGEINVQEDFVLE